MKKIRIVLEEFVADHYYECVVRKGGNSSRVYLPKEVSAGTKVIVIVKPEED